MSVLHINLFFIAYRRWSGTRAIFRTIQTHGGRARAGDNAHTSVDMFHMCIVSVLCRTEHFKNWHTQSINRIIHRISSKILLIFSRRD